MAVVVQVVYSFFMTTPTHEVHTLIHLCPRVADNTASALPSIGGNIQQAYRGRGALPFQQDFAEGPFGAFRP